MSLGLIKETTTDNYEISQAMYTSYIFILRDKDSRVLNLL